MAPALAARSAANQAHNRAVIMKLALFTVLMFLVPIATYYVLHDTLLAGWENRTMWSGFGAIGMVNVVIFVYILEAFREDAAASSKETVPAVGKFKKQ
ncbi:hypothetical protein SPRG_12560 [Saprolegnia parasitica CBS 223.65]|uniref:Vacuolar ATPase assembly integral membrane protein VMA21 homolog n=1 Tax=Saprolegnia parasitica (strain CBS 223.65) TaxID=695850 RepID=A0A067C0E3_SAPPC|nr:hypothetical protein SPRG_12560 [Saprolegnia parasitica CBS 223.65]KDO22580.1 hypothetical protein SPRG_12560 [Saprolegnia parasitica CBS 223.65]|eukprot:XP_012206696.1 hypothetical protein SPRG_12560 [Saprolegnia parasitica CBS 223.65]